MNGYQYVNAVLDFFPTPDGYVKATLGRLGVYTYSYVYDYKDHLGNNRLSYTTSLTIGDPNLIVMDENHYYPFGLKHNGYSATQQLMLPTEQPPYVVLVAAPTATAGSYKIKYNGKELQDELGLNIYDYGARNYDPAIGRWFNVDNLAEEYYDYSPYNYVFNDPVKHIDPDGNGPTDIIIYGKNNSSLTIKTDLINVSVNAGGLIGDIGGNYPVGGNEILGAALDIVGIFDPTGIADGLAAGLAANQGNWGDAIISGFGIIPYAGDFAKVGKIEKDVKIIDKAIDAAKGADKAGDAGKSAKQLLKEGRAGKQERLAEIANDTKASKSDRGWIKSEQRQVATGNRKTVRNPPGKDLAHPRGKEAAKGTLIKILSYKIEIYIEDSTDMTIMGKKIKKIQTKI